jgi:hypothetical protein
LPISWKSPAAAQTLRALLYKSDEVIVLQKIGIPGTYHLCSVNAFVINASRSLSEPSTAV